MIKVSAHQINFLPWPGFWHKLISSDIFVVCAGFKYTKKSFINRVKMADNNDWAIIPVNYKPRGEENLDGKSPEGDPQLTPDEARKQYDIEMSGLDESQAHIPIKDIAITNPSDLAQIGRRIQHWSQMKQYHYGERLTPIIDYLKNCHEIFLYKINYDLIQLISEILGIKDTKIVLDLNTREGMSIGSTISKIVNLHGDAYLCGSSGPNYLTTQDLKEVNKIWIQELKKDIPKYSVLHFIAEEKEPLTTLQNLGTWKKWPKPTLAA